MAILSCVVACSLSSVTTASAHWIRTPGQIKKIHSTEWKISALKMNLSHSSGFLKWYKHNKHVLGQRGRHLSKGHLYIVRFSNARISELTATMAPVVDSCTDQLLRREGGYNPHKWNGGHVAPWTPYTTYGGSGAYGGPQALPGSKMASAGPDWRDNIWTQIKWMQGYMNSRYGGSCNALAFQMANGYY